MIFPCSTSSTQHLEVLKQHMHCSTPYHRSPVFKQRLLGLIIADKLCCANDAVSDQVCQIALVQALQTARWTVAVTVLLIGGATASSLVPCMKSL